MRQLKKIILWIGCLALGLQTVGAFSLLGPITGTPDASWQITLIGYNPLNLGSAPPFLLDPLVTGPKNLGEGYRRNTPGMFYAFDATFGDFFGSNGEFAVQQAFDLVNGVMNGQTNKALYLYSPNNGILGDTNGAPAITLFPTNSLDRYSAALTEFPFNSEGENYTASALGLLDIKSETMPILMEQLGLADSVRYVWALRNRYTGVIGESCTVPGPGNLIEYNVIQRNFDIVPSALNQLQYSAYVNGQLYSYWIDENCGAPAASPPDVDALEIPADTLNNVPPVASGFGEFPLPIGFFYTGLTRDDVGGLRFLYSTNNWDTPSVQYRESPAAGSLMFSTNFNAPQLLSTSNFNTLVSAATTNNPATLQALFPGLIVGNNPITYFSNVVSPNVVAFFTNYVGSPAGAPPVLVVETNLVTNIVQFFQNSFANVVTNKIYTNATFAIQTITVGPMNGSPAGSPFVTNITYQPFQTNVPSGDYFIISNGACGPNIVQILQTNVNIVTNLVVGTTNVNGQSFVENLISYFTNYTFEVEPCTLVTNGVADYQGIARMQFFRVNDGNYDYQSGQFITPITNQYTMVVFTNGQYITQAFQRVVTAPDFLIMAFDQLNGPDALPTEVAFTRNINFNQANVQTGLAGPGTINTPTTIAYNKVGPVFLNESPATMIGPTGAGRTGFIWGSFDGTTNTPVVYPNGTSLENLANEAVIQVTPPPPTLPTGTNGVGYNITFTANGTSGAVSWTLASFSAGLPPGLNLSPGGVLSGTATQSGTFDNIVVQITDSSTPPRVVQTSYSLTIN